MSGQHPSKWASARCLLAQGRAMGRGTLATSPFIPPGTGRVGAARAFSIPRGWRLDCVSAPGRAEWGFFLVVSLLCFSFPASLGFSGRVWEAAVVCLFVCPSAEHPAGLREVGHGCPGQEGHLRCCGGSCRAGLWWLCFPILLWPLWPQEFPQRRAVVPFQEFLEDALSVFHGAKPSPELCCSAPALWGW